MFPRADSKLLLLGASLFHSVSLSYSLSHSPPAILLHGYLYTHRTLCPCPVLCEMLGTEGQALSPHHFRGLSPGFYTMPARKLSTYGK